MGVGKTRAAVALYAFVAALAIALGFLRQAPNVYHHPEPLLTLPLWAELLAGVAAGLVVGRGVVWLTQRAVTGWRLGPAIRLHEGLRELLELSEQPLRESQVLALAASSAVAEELLFRGLAQPVIGLVPAALLFGALHYPPGRRDMLAWVPMAVAIGLVFGGLFVALGGLTAPIVAHFTINYANLHFIGSFDPSVAGRTDHLGGAR